MTDRQQLQAFRPLGHQGWSKILFQSGEAGIVSVHDQTKMGRTLLHQPHVKAHEVKRFKKCLQMVLCQKTLVCGGHLKPNLMVPPNEHRHVWDQPRERVDVRAGAGGVDKGTDLQRQARLLEGLDRSGVNDPCTVVTQFNRLRMVHSGDSDRFWVPLGSAFIMPGTSFQMVTDAQWVATASKAAL